MILSGGSGSRLWPLSREATPKQFLPLAGPRTLLQETAMRVMDPARFAPITVVANTEHRFIIAEQLREIGLRPQALVLEPQGRNTAPAVAAAALLAAKEDPDALILVMPADHVVQDVPAFLAAVEAGEAAARQGALVLFGIRPTGPATGYGYIRQGAPYGAAEGVYSVASFVEKPDLATAEGYLASGEYSWNSGIFLLPVRALLDELAAHEGEVLSKTMAALSKAAVDDDFLRLDPAAWAACPSISIDYAVMERTKNAAVTPVDIGWTDVGAWSALWEIGDKDEGGNVRVGDVVARDANGCYLRSEGPLVAVVGVQDLVVVAMADAVLVVGKDADQGVKTLVEAMRAEGRREASQGAPSMDDVVQLADRRTRARG